jgi:hypothetical protein
MWLAVKTCEEWLTIQEQGIGTVGKVEVVRLSTSILSLLRRSPANNIPNFLRRVGGFTSHPPQKTGRFFSRNRFNYTNSLKTHYR